MSLGSEFILYRDTVIRYLWLIILVAVIAVVSVLVISYRATPMFASSATVRLATVPGGLLELDFNAQSTRLMNTASKIVETAQFHDQVTARLNARPKTGFSVTASPVADTELLEIMAQSSDATLAKNAADAAASVLSGLSLEIYGGGTTASTLAALGTRLQEMLADLESAGEGPVTATQTVTIRPDLQSAAASELAAARRDAYLNLFQRYEDFKFRNQVLANAISIIDPAYLPDGPVSPRISLNVTLALVGGLIAGTVLAFVAEAMTTTIHDRKELATLTHAPIIGTVPQTSAHLTGFQSKQISKDELRFSSAVYDRLGARLLAFQPACSPSTLLITSAEPGTGKTTIASYLGVELSRAGFRVVLVDADFRHKSLTRKFNLVGRPGLAEVLGRADQSVNDALQNTSFSRLKVLPVGCAVTGANGLLTPSRVTQLLGRLRTTCEYILIDAPSLLLVGDATVLAKQASVVLVVVSQRHTEKSQFQTALTRMAEAEVSNIAVVLNRVPQQRVDRYYDK